MRIVVALDKFKGSLDAPAACEIVARALREARPGIETVLRPMADGGDGTARAMLAARGGTWVAEKVTGPLPHRTIEAGYGWFENDRSAVVEMAVASGLALLKPAEHDPLRTTTFGTGELVAAALRRGAQRLWLGVGGSATVDGGVGAAMAMGWRFLDADGRPIGLGGGELERIARIVPPHSSIPHLQSPISHLQSPISIEVLCDVDNPLCGEHGAARVFGPQKGATLAMVDRLDAALARLAKLVREQLGKEILDVPGAGAAGGLAAGAIAFLDARVVPGIDTVMAVCALEQAMRGADWVITGEGKFDDQSLRGKVVSGVTRLARAHGVKVAVLAGSVQLPADRYRTHHIEAALPTMRSGMTLEYAMDHAADLLARTARRFAEEFLRQGSGSHHREDETPSSR